MIIISPLVGTLPKSQVAGSSQSPSVTEVMVALKTRLDERSKKKGINKSPHWYSLKFILLIVAKLYRNIDVLLLRYDK